MQTGRLSAGCSAVHRQAKPSGLVAHLMHMKCAFCFSSEAAVTLCKLVYDASNQLPTTRLGNADTSTQRPVFCVHTCAVDTLTGEVCSSGCDTQK